LNISPNQLKGIKGRHASLNNQIIGQADYSKTVIQQGLDRLNKWIARRASMKDGVNTAIPQREANAAKRAKHIGPKFIACFSPLLEQAANEPQHPDDELTPERRIPFTSINAKAP
jgi:hypothetical protein